MAEHTLGRRIVESRDEAEPVVRIFGEEYKVNAKVVVLNSFSAHADKSSECAWLEFSPASVRCFGNTAQSSPLPSVCKRKRWSFLPSCG